MKIKNLLLGLAFISSVLAFAQKRSFSWYQTNFPKEHAVKLIDEINIVIDYDKDSKLTVSRNMYDEKLLLTNQAGAFSERQIIFSSFFDIRNVEAATYIPRSSGSFTRRGIQEFKTEKIMSDRVFHDDLMAIKFQYPELQAGSKIDLSYTEDVLNPFFIPPVYFQDSYFAEKIKVTLEAPENVKIKIKEFNVAEGSLNYSSRTKRGVVTHTWEVDSVPYYKSEGGAPSPTYFIPHIAFIVEGYENKGEEVPVLRGVDDLYSWYSGLLDSVDFSLTPDLVNIVDSISNQFPDDLKRAQALYNWVRKSIKYIAVEDGLGGFIPDNPTAVSHKRFGDCKGMSCLLATLMRQAELDAHECWIGTRDIPYTYTENYTPFADNHMIAAFRHKGEWIFLDATDPYVPFAYPSAFIQGKEALIGVGKGKYELVKVPIIEQSKNQINISDSLSIDGLVLRGKANMKLTGYDAGRFKRLYRKTEDESRFFKYYLQAGNDKFELEAIPTVEAKDTTIQFDYNFLLPDYVRSFDDKYLLNLSMDRIFSESIFENRKLPVERDYKHSYSFTHFVNVPNGFSVLALPEKFEFAADFASASIEYKQENGGVIYKMRITMDTLLMPAEQSEEWNDFVKMLRKEYRKNVEFVKVN